MDIYSRKFRVLSSDTDMNRRMHLSALFTHLQNAAIAHTESLGAGRNKTLDKGLLWVVVMQEARIRRMPVYDDLLTLTSWPGSTMHVFFPRYWQISDECGEILVEASSLWTLMSCSERKLVFPEEHAITIPDMNQGRNTFLPGRIKAKSAPVLQEFTVPFSYTDLNGHMNNVRYFDLAADCMPEQMHSRHFSRIRVEYIEECRLGETMVLRALKEADTWYFSGETDRSLFRMVFE